MAMTVTRASQGPQEHVVRLGRAVQLVLLVRQVHAVQQVLRVDWVQPVRPVLVERQVHAV
jgi:hypothetical protein